MITVHECGQTPPPDNIRKRVHVFGTTRKEAPAKLAENIAVSNLGVSAPSTQGSLTPCLTYRLENIAVHQLARTSTPATPPACACTSSPAWARRSPLTAC